MDYIRFKAKILKCVDKGLDSIGDIAKRVLYWHLRNTFKITLEDVPDNPEKLVEALYGMYGPAASVLESNIVDEITREFQLVDRPKGFADAVNKAKAVARML